MKKLNTLNLIKGIGIIMIIMVHNRHFLMQDMSGLRPLINFGQMGCQLFFFVSGFSLCFSWEHMTCSTSSKPVVSTYFQFLLRRYLRLAPGFLIIMISNLVLNILLMDILNFPPGFIMNKEPFAILTNILFIHGLFPDYINNVFPGGWYLGTAFLLYAAFPLLYGIMKKLFYRLPILMNAVPIVLLLFNHCLLHWITVMTKNALYPSNNSFLYFFFTNHLPCFSLGILLYFQEKKNFSAKCPILISVPFFLVSWFLCIGMFLMPDTHYLFTIIPSVAGLSVYWLGVALIHFEKKPGKHFSSFFARFLAECGQSSYGMYLVHAFVCWYGMKALNYFLTINGSAYNDILVYMLLLVPSVFVVFVLGLYMERLLFWIDKKLRPA